LIAALKLRYRTGCTALETDLLFTALNRLKACAVRKFRL